MPSMPQTPNSAPTADRQGLLGPIQGAFHLFTGQIARLVFQALYIVLVTRGLGAEDFARYSALQALLIGLVPFTAMGFPILALRAVARDPERRAAIWSAGLRMILILGGVGSLLVAFLAPGILNVSFPRLPILLFAFSELIFFGLVNLVNGVLQGGERLDRMARVLAGLSFARLVAVAALYYGPGLDLPGFALAHFGGTLLCLLIALRAYGRGWAWPPSAEGGAAMRAGLRDGFTIAVSASGRSFLMGLDRMLLPAMAGLTAAAQYGAGFRVAAYALMPLQAFMAALYPRFFRRGARSLGDGLALWRRSAPLALAYALPVAVILYFMAPLLTLVFGAEYPEAPTVLRHLVWLLLLQALYIPLGDALSGADHFTYRGISIVAALVLNLGLNLWLIPRLGWRGAVIAAYGAQSLLLIMYALKVGLVNRGERSSS